MLQEKVQIKEHFLGFATVSTQRTAITLYNIVHSIIVQSIIADLNCDSKLVEQNYNGAE